MCEAHQTQWAHTATNITRTVDFSHFIWAPLQQMQHSHHCPIHPSKIINTHTHGRCSVWNHLFLLLRNLKYEFFIAYKCNNHMFVNVCLNCTIIFDSTGQIGSHSFSYACRIYWSCSFKLIEAQILAIGLRQCQQNQQIQ